MTTTKSLVDIFNDYFDMVPAITDELKAEVYRLRYQVYCLETGFEDPSDYPDGLEFDEFDSHSVHYLIYHRKQGVYMATTRLILPAADNIDKLFPIEIHCPIDNLEALQHVSRPHLAEASRFCVSKDFRRRKNEMNTVMGINTEAENVFSQDERRIFPHITLALFACLIRMSCENDVRDWYAVMEPALIRVFSTLGMDFIGIGPLTDYHGKRRPCTIKVSDLLSGVEHKDLNSWHMLTNHGQFVQ
ncbi:MAG: PEP-CTERM/exosortase system-associated acyltransferase [Methylococcaceae bacterium]|nr:PEP-CTERM/exosortase system-associated acyltransferase [Methylococcaceae bacterium]